MKNTRNPRALPRIIGASGVAIILCSTLASEPLPPIPAPEQLPGQLVFHGHYRHRSRGSDIQQPSELWLNQTPENAIVALASLPFMQSTELATGDNLNKVKRYAVRVSAAANRPAYGIDIEFEDTKALLTRRGVREDCTHKELPVPMGAVYDPNSRPDSYCAANIILRKFSKPKPNESAELKVFDWDNTGEAFAEYTVKIEFTGREKVQVPAGDFEANHYLLTQTSSADTWFKKRTGHKTDFWVLDNGVIVRVLRHREPYELILLDYDFPPKLPGLVER